MLLVVASVSLSLVVFFRFPHASRDFILGIPLSLVHCLLEAVCWGMHSLIVVMCITMTTNFILEMVPSCQWENRLILGTKSVIPMVICCVCYLDRCVWLVVACLTKPQLRETWAWYIGFLWLPTALSSTVLLYSVRKRDIVATDIGSDDPGNLQRNNSNDNEHDDNDMRQSLLARPQPPEEAFRAFSKFRRWEDNGETDDDEFTCGSPMPHFFVRPSSSNNGGDDAEVGACDVSTLTIDEVLAKSRKERSQSMPL
jgi:hypothetical protein